MPATHLLGEEVGGDGLLADLASAGLEEADFDLDAAEGLGIGGDGFALGSVVLAVDIVVVVAVGLGVHAGDSHLWKRGEWRELKDAVALEIERPGVVRASDVVDVQVEAISVIGLRGNLRGSGSGECGRKIGQAGEVRKADAAGGHCVVQSKSISIAVVTKIDVGT